LACLWFAVGRHEADHDGWVYRTGFDDADYSEQYLISLQWSMAQFTPGAPPMSAKRPVERLFNIFVLACSMVFATCFISSITSTMGSVWSVSNYHRTQSVLLRKFLHQSSLPSELGSRITRFVEFVIEYRHKRVHYSRVKYLELLSGPLQLELKVELYKPTILPHTFFAQVESLCPGGLIKICSKAVDQNQFARADTIFECGEVAKELTFITTGSGAYRVADGNKEWRRMLRAGMWFSEGALWMEWRRRGDMRSLTTMDVLTVNAAKFADGAGAVLEAYALARSHALAFWSVMKRLDRASRSSERLFDDVTSSPEEDWPEFVTDLPVAAAASAEQVAKDGRQARTEVLKAEEMEAASFAWSDQ